MRIKKIMAILIAAVLIFGLTACTNNSTGAATDPASMDIIQSKIYDTTKDFLVSEGVGDPDVDYSDGRIPGYFIERLKNGDEQFDTYLQGIGVDPSAVEDFYQIQSMIMVNANCVMVLRVNDMAKAKAGLGQFHEGQLKIWESYLPDQYKKTQNNVTESTGDYLYYVTSDIQDDILAVIRQTLK